MCWEEYNFNLLTWIPIWDEKGGIIIESTWFLKRQTIYVIVLVQRLMLKSYNKIRQNICTFALSLLGIMISGVNTLLFEFWNATNRRPQYQQQEFSHRKQQLHFYHLARYTESIFLFVFLLICVTQDDVVKRVKPSRDRRGFRVSLVRVHHGGQRL